MCHHVLVSDCFPSIRTNFIKSLICRLCFLPYVFFSNSPSHNQHICTSYSYVYYFLSVVCSLFLSPYLSLLLSPFLSHSLFLSFFFTRDYQFTQLSKNYFTLLTTFLFPLFSSSFWISEVSRMLFSTCGVEPLQKSIPTCQNHYDGTYVLADNRNTSRFLSSFIQFFHLYFHLCVFFLFFSNLNFYDLFFIFTELFRLMFIVISWYWYYYFIFPIVLNSANLSEFQLHSAGDGHGPMHVQVRE